MTLGTKPTDEDARAIAEDVFRRERTLFEFDASPALSPNVKRLQSPPTTIPAPATGAKRT